MRLVMGILLASLAASAFADEVRRDLADLEPINPNVNRLDFTISGFRVDLPSAEVAQRLGGLGFKLINSASSSIQVIVDGKSLSTDAYVSTTSFSKFSADHVTEETLQLAFLPGNGGTFGVVRHVDFHYREGQQRLKGAQVEAALIEKFGKPMKIFEKKLGEELLADTTNSVLAMGFYCFDSTAAPIAEPGKCDADAVQDNGYSYAIKINRKGDVLAFEIVYTNTSYQKAYKSAIEEKLKYLLKTDQVWEYRAPRLEL